jgi:hypothetical protein
LTEINFEKFDWEKSLDQQRKLFIECFPENIGTSVETLDHYKWKFCSFPSEVKSYEYVASLSKKIIGYYAAVPHNYLLNGKPAIAGMVCDIMVGKTARGKGVFTKLGQFSINQLRDEGIDFTTGNPIRPEVIPGHKKVGWETPFELPMYGKFISFDSFFDSKKLSILTFSANIILKILEKSLSLFRFREKDIQIESYNQYEVKSIFGLQEFFDNLNKEIPIYLCKNNAFLNWRLGAPEKKYSIIIIRKNKKIIAYSIASFMVKKKVFCLGILDLAILKRFEKYSSILLQENEILAKENNAELILTMIGKNWAKKFDFFTNGFFKTPYKFTFIINKLNESLNSEQIFNKDNWHLMWIDSDNL